MTFSRVRRSTATRCSGCLCSSCAISATDVHHGWLEAQISARLRRSSAWREVKVSGTVSPSIEALVQGRTSACRRRRPASARPSLPLPGAAEA
jgi:hypothetical protein